MGCAGSKMGSALGRLSSYQIAAEAETDGLTHSPSPLLEEEAAVAAQGKLFPFLFHNIFYDGFYAPYIRNPDYLLIIDTREEEKAYEMGHVVTAQWHGRLPWLKDIKEQKEKLGRYCHVVLYDSDGSCINVEDSSMGRISKILRDQHVEPLLLDGGLQALTKSCPHLVITPSDGPHTLLMGSRLAMSWFPSIVLDGQLYLGRRDQASDPSVLVGLHVTHIVSVVDSSSPIPVTPSPTLNFLVVPLPLDASENTSDSRNVIESANDESDEKVSEKVDGKVEKATKVQKEQQEKKPDADIIDFESQLPTLAAFVQDALNGNGENVVNGRVLISGEQGVNRSAALVMAFLMKDRACSLEDAYYYVRRCRPAVQLSETLLRSLAHLEANIFGRSVTNIEDLGY